jgi:hypothetical protein
MLQPGSHRAGHCGWIASCVRRAHVKRKPAALGHSNPNPGCDQPRAARVHSLVFPRAFPTRCPAFTPSFDFAQVPKGDRGTTCVLTSHHPQDTEQGCSRDTTDLDLVVTYMLSSGKNKEKKRFNPPWSAHGHLGTRAIVSVVAITAGVHSLPPSPKALESNPCCSERVSYPHPKHLLTLNVELRRPAFTCGQLLLLAYY